MGGDTEVHLDAIVGITSGAAVHSTALCCINSGVVVTDRSGVGNAALEDIHPITTIGYAAGVRDVALLGENSSETVAGGDGVSDAPLEGVDSIGAIVRSGGVGDASLDGRETADTVAGGDEMREDGRLAIEQDAILAPLDGELGQNDSVRRSGEFVRDPSIPTFFRKCGLPWTQAGGGADTTARDAAIFDFNATDPGT